MNDVRMVKNILAIVHPNIDAVKLDVENVTRMGRNKRQGYTRPIKIKLQDSESKGKIFRNSGKLKLNETYKQVNVSNDKTTKEIEADKKLKSELDRQRALRPGDDLIIYRGDIIRRADRPR